MELKSDYEVPLYYLGELYYKLGNNILAKEYLRKYIKRCPDESEASDLLEKVNNQIKNK